MAERETERVIYTDGGRRGGGTAAIVLLVIALLVILFLVFGRGLLNGGSATKTINADVHVSGDKGG
ncbi:MAG TPA: hypothetical protein VH331_08600 [Allosphingosinicella sp.]|jgi:hypothetical protein|nr:hypothetical protein [Allosphingosinicella sp.]